LLDNFKDIKLPAIEPLIKLVPTIKLIGKLMVSLKIKLILDFLELFCIPISNKINKQELKISKENIFLKVGMIWFFIGLNFNTNYISYFW